MGANNLRLSTDYPLDKIIDTYVGSFTANARGGGDLNIQSTATIQTNIGGMTFPIGIYSYDNAIWYPLNVAQITVASGFPNFQTVEVSCYTTDNTLVMVASNYLTSSFTIYYKIELVSPS